MPVLTDLDRLLPRPGFIRPADGAVLAGQRIGVTGASGVLGRLFLDRFNGARNAVNAFAGDVRDTPALARWVGEGGFDVIVHLAAVVSTSKALADPTAAMATNALGVANLLGVLAHNLQRPWVFVASTSHVYSPQEAIALDEGAACAPISYYGSTKLAAEMLARPLAEQLAIPVCIGRIFSFFHETQGAGFLVPNLAHHLRNAGEGELVEIKDSDSVRDFLYAGWVVDAVLQLAHRRTEGTVNIGSGVPVEVGEIAERLRKMINPAAVLALRRSGRPTRLVADVSRLRSSIGATCA